MRINVSDITEDGLLLETELPIKIYDSQGHDTAHVVIKLYRFGKKVLIDGSVRISASLKCGRCLKDFVHPLDIYFKEEYSPAETMIKQHEYELSDSELNLNYYKDDELDISEIITEQVLLSVPMKPLCRRDCKGICPVCGKDHNKESCTCRNKDLDPRLALLQKLKEKIKD